MTAAKGPRRWKGGSAVAVRPRGIGGGVPLLGVPCALGAGADVEGDIALFDTGAEWSVVAPSVAKSAGAVSTGERFALSTRHGSIPGELQKVSVTILATTGAPLVVAATVFVPDKWDVDAPRVVLGFRGLLEVVRFAVTPERGGHSLWFAA